MTNTKIIGAQPQQKAMQTPCPQKNQVNVCQVKHRKHPYQFGK